MKWKCNNFYYILHSYLQFCFNDFRCYFKKCLQQAYLPVSHFSSFSLSSCPIHFARKVLLNYHHIIQKINTKLGILSFQTCIYKLRDHLYIIRNNIKDGTISNRMIPFESLCDNFVINSLFSQHCTLTKKKIVISQLQTRSCPEFANFRQLFFNVKYLIFHFC